MKIFQAIPSINISSGGPARSSTNLVKNLVVINKTTLIKLYTLKTNSTPIIRNFKNKNAMLIFCKSSIFGYSLDFRKKLIFDLPNLYHGHSIWNLIIYQMASSARKKNIPYIISTRGMLEPWSLTQSKFIKKLALFLYQRRDLKLASCIHATATSEAKAIRDLGFKNPIAIIPNGINLEEYPKYKKNINANRKVLFLSRIHKKKGIEYLINAWNELDTTLTKNWEVNIVGNGDEKYIRSLKKLINEKKLNNSITISKPLQGADKIKKYRESDLFVLPTHSENFGIVIAEALASSLPVITTKGTPWEELIKYRCGDWIEIGKNPLRESLSKMLKKTDSELSEMGQRGRLLIEKKYNMRVVAMDMNLLYMWLLGKIEKPDFVI
jgi:glycosyltransferase involved in cell wall biosynthesis